jgi:hypothetical protein
MATRFAGDFFGVPLSQGTDESELVKYFPGLRDTYHFIRQTENDKKGPRLTGNLQGSRAFAGFKLFEAPK